jgi:hypothetical protein
MIAILYSQFIYSFLQYGAGITVFILFFILFTYLTESLKYNKILTAVIILTIYFIIGFGTINVSKRQISSICEDGFESSSTGSGACSSHGGVFLKIYKVKYKDYEEPWNTMHKFFYFWYALNEDHEESEMVFDEEDYENADPETKYMIRR